MKSRKINFKKHFLNLWDFIKYQCYCELYVVKTKTKNENSEQLIHLNLSYTNCIYLYINGTKVPKISNAWVKPVSENGEILIKAKGVLNTVNISIQSNSADIKIKLPKELGSIYKNSYYISNLGPLKGAKLNPLGFKIDYNTNLKKHEVRLGLNNVKLKKHNIILKTNNYNIQELT